ncbi:putative ankyrin repeat protein [Cotonvirus japonicus]|uniref:Ankyrin repeat protein n=1 Tax=Cotonvirus japonicus TaxID=2811091 RepID=A0ABM7NQV1_9VIRU|nr:putative ankyrin repeat protein [Cotonvirus japonicus]BCS82549.1 putative ankyrin repeat protein [Cotonvirus japonicus]
MSSKLYFKITNERECHYGYQYQNGLNILKSKFNNNPKNSCVPGRLYFSKPKHIHHYFNYGVNLREVYLPINNPDFKMIKDLEGNKYGANMVIFGKKHSLTDPETWEFMINQGLDLYVNNNEAIKNAIESGYFLIIKNLLKHKYNINICNQILTEQLNTAVLRRDLDKVKYLVENGADINFDRGLAIKNASSNGFLSIVQYLVKNGANIHADNDCAVRHALTNEHLDLAKYLVSVGANIHAVDNYALRWASRRGHFKIVQYIVENGAIYYVANNSLCSFDNPIYNANQKCHTKIVKYLNKNVSVKKYKTNYQDYNLMKLACRRDDINQLKLLVEKGIDIHYEDDYALRHAAREGSLEMVQYLIDNGAYVHARNEYALKWTKKRHYQNISEYLIKNGAIDNGNIIYF